MEGRSEGSSGEHFRWMLIDALTDKSLSDPNRRACADKHRCGPFHEWEDDLESSYGLSEETRDSVGVSVRCGCVSYADRACATGFVKLQPKILVLVKGNKGTSFNIVPRMATIFVVLCLLLLDTRPTVAANNGK